LAMVYGGRMDETGKIHRQPDLAAMRRDLFSSSISDGRTRETIKAVWDKYQLLLEPHGAVAWRGFEDWLESEIEDRRSKIGTPNPELRTPNSELLSPVAVLETANPAKFPEEIERMMGWSPDIPAAMEITNRLPEDFDRMDADYEKFKAYLLAKHA